MDTCPRCKNRLLRDNPHYCSKCGLDLTKKNSGEFSISPKTFFILIGLLFLFSLIALSAFAYFIPLNLEYSDSFDASEIIGDGQSEFEIPVKITNLYGVPSPNTELKATASSGKIVSCTTDENGECILLFTPEKTAFFESCEIKINAGLLQKIIIIEVSPDYAESISLIFEEDSVPADGMSTTKITAVPLDHLGNSVPDGTPVEFETDPVNFGSISKTSCSISSGNCSITYISAETPGSIDIYAYSGNTQTKKSLKVAALDPYKLTLSSLEDYIVGDGETTATITVLAEDILGNPVQEYEIFFTATHGLIEDSCTTGSNGKCIVTYTSANLIGQEKIYAISPKTNASLILELIGYSDLEITAYLHPYIGDPIVPAFALNTGYLEEPMLELQVYNKGTTSFNGKITVEILDWSSSQIKQFSVSPKSTKGLSFSPSLNENVFENLQMQSAQYLITIEDSEENVIFQESKSVDLYPYNSMLWFEPYFGDNADPINDLIVSWVTPESSEIHSLVSDAAQYTPTNSILGYQNYSTGCGSLGTSSCTQSESTLLQMKAIYLKLQSENMHYVNAPGNYFSNAQTVYTPDQSLEAGGANCIDGALVFASAVVSMGMDAYLILVPGHAFVCVVEEPSGQYISCVETTMIGSGASFEDALIEAADEFTYYNSLDQINLIHVNSILAQLKTIG